MGAGGLRFRGIGGGICCQRIGIEQYLIRKWEKRESKFRPRGCPVEPDLQERVGAWLVAGDVVARVCQSGENNMKHSKRRQRVAPSSKFVSFDNAGPCRMERLEDRQLLSATIDLRTASGGKTVNITSVGQVVNLDVWAVVRGTDNDATNDAFQWAHGSFLSTNVNGGAAFGSLSAAVTNQFATQVSQNGTQVDLDGDGDLDVGSNNDSQPWDYFIARADGMQGGSNPAPAQFLIGTVSFIVNSL